MEVLLCSMPIILYYRIPNNEWSGDTPIPVKRKVPPTSTLLFSLAIDHVMREHNMVYSVREAYGYKITPPEHIKLLAFADDLAIAKNKEAASALINMVDTQLHS